MIRILLFFLILLIVFTNQTLAVSNPSSKPVNKFGINILAPEAEIEEAAQLINSNGDWGWVVVVIKKSERNVDRWQSFLNLAAKNHVIPIFRLATDFTSEQYWQKPSDEDAKDWADFFSKLYWPTKNRYVQVYNEVNRSGEWGGVVDAAGYAKELNKTIDALKAKSKDFFVLNAPLDLALDTSNSSLDAAVFFRTMESSVPEIFNKLDGWASHSYPNPDFSASPLKSGKTGIDGYKWEISQIQKYTGGKDLPIFITETGWKRGDKYSGGLTEEQISNYYKTAFEKVWSDQKIAVVAPFLLNYPQPLFYPFSFKTNRGDKTFYDYYSAIKELPKIKGQPERENLAAILHASEPFEVIKSFTAEKINIKIKNTGNYIWHTQSGLNLKFESPNIEIGKINWSKNEVYPGQDTIATIEFKTNKEGLQMINLTLEDSQEKLTETEIAIESKTYFSVLVETLLLVFNSFYNS